MAQLNIPASRPGTTAVAKWLPVLLLVLALGWLARPLMDSKQEVDAGILAQAHAATPARTLHWHTIPAWQIKQEQIGQWRQHTRLAQRRADALLVRRRAVAALHQNFQLHGIGAQLYTAWGTPFTLRAINWYGFEFAPFVPGGLDRVTLDSILSRLHAIGFNALRIQFADETVRQNPVVMSGVAANPGLRGLHALDIMQRILARAHHFGLRVILCNSRSEAGMGPEMKSGLWYTREYPESVWQADWLELAQRFRNESAFVGADLRNEPHQTGTKFDLNAYFKLGPLWGAFHDQYYHDRDWHYAAQTMGNALLKVNPHLLIVVEGVQMYYDPDRNRLFGGLWGSNLIGVQYDPIQLNRPGQLVYSAHEYGPHMYVASWFNRLTSYESLARRWDHHWGYLLRAPMSMRAPVFLGEFGTCNNYWSCIDNHQVWKQGFWFKSFVRYLHAHPEVGWGYWALNPDGPFYQGQDDFYSLMTHDWRATHPWLMRGLAPLLGTGPAKS